MLKRPMCLISLAFVAIIYVVLHIMPPQEFVSTVEDGEHIEISGQVYQKECKNGKYSIYLKETVISEIVGETNQTYKTIVYINDSKEAQKIKYGAFVKVAGKLNYFGKAENEGQFDANIYYRVLGIDFSVNQATVVAMSEEYNIGREKLFVFRERMKEVYKKNLPEKEAGILQALILGDKGELSPEIKELYMRAGISHILSLSGLHIATAGLCILSLLRKCRVRLIVASIISVLLIIGYGLMTGLGTSTLRALIMFFLSVLAMCTGRAYDILSAVSLAAVLILIENPLYLYHTGFQLSFGAIMGIGLLYPCLTIIVPSKNKFLQTILLNSSIQLFTLPIVLWCFFSFPVYGIVVNLLIVPLVAVILVLGFIGGLIGSFLQPLSIVFLAPCKYILWFYEKVCYFSTNIPGSAWITGRPKMWAIVMFYSCLIIMMIVISKLHGRYKYVDLKQEKNKAKYKGERRRISLGFIIIMSIAIAMLTFKETEEIKITMLSVGQGECSVIHGSDIPTIMIDGGSTDVSEVAKYRIIPYLKANRLTTIECIFISHSDEDHINGVLELLQMPQSGIYVKKVVLPKISQQYRNNCYNELIQIAEERGIEVYVIEKGNIIPSGLIMFECLNPSLSRATEDINDNAMVLDMRYHEIDGDSFLSALFTGDISREIEEQILSEVQDCNILKVAHHGAKSSTCEKFLDTAEPEIALISAGKNNSYGHPHKETILRLQKCKNMKENQSIYITYNTGQIDITMEKGLLKIRSFILDSQIK